MRDANLEREAMRAHEAPPRPKKTARPKSAKRSRA
jgi:hypothetical protein